MKKVAVVFLFTVMFMLFIIPVEGALKPAAKSAGYHSILYSDRIDTTDNTLNYINIIPQTFNIGWGIPGRYLSIVGDASGNYVFSAVGGNAVSFSDNVIVNVGSNLIVSNGFVTMGAMNVINSGGYWVGQPIDSSYIILPANVAITGSCPAGQVVTGTTTSGVICTADQVGSFSLPANVAITGSCPAGQVVIATTSSGVTCAVDATGGSGSSGSSIPLPTSCPVGNYVSGFDASGNPTCAPDATSGGGGSIPLPTSCAAGKVITGFDASGNPICATDSIGAGTPICTAGQTLIWTGGWTCQNVKGAFVSLPPNGYYDNRLEISSVVEDQHVDVNDYGVPNGASAVLISAELYRICPSAAGRYGHVIFRPIGSGSLLNVLRAGDPSCSSAWTWYTFGTFIVPLDSNGQFTLSYGSGSGTPTDWFRSMTIYFMGYYT
jgi:hypothetical protein